MWLNVIQAKLTSKQCWSAVSPAILGEARCLQLGHLVIYAVACLQSVAKCCCNSLLFAYHLVLWFFPIPPSLLRYGLGKYCSVSIPLNCSVRRCWWGPLAGLPWIPPPHARALPGSTKFVGTNAQAHLLVMSLIQVKIFQPRLILNFLCLFALTTILFTSELILTGLDLYH